MIKPAVEALGGRRRHSRWGGSVVVAVAVTILAMSNVTTPARAAPLVTAGPAASTTTSTATSFENEPLRNRSDSTGSKGSNPLIPSGPTAGAAGDLSHVVLALAIVIGIIFALRWVARRFSLVPNVGKAGRGVTVLSRTVLAPKQQVLLLQVGRRIVVVGDGGAAGMRTLCEITDPNEVAALIGELKSSDAAALGNKSFGNQFRRAAEPFGGEDAAETPALATPPDGATDVAASDVVGLLDKVRGLRQQFDR